DYDRFVGTNGSGNQVRLGGTAILELDLLGLAEGGTLTGAAKSPFVWANQLSGRFINAPNLTGGNILPAADVLNNPTGFVATVSYGAGFLTVVLTRPTVSSPRAFVSAAFGPQGEVL